MDFPEFHQHILITGAAGFIGQALASSLLSPSNPATRELASITLTDITQPNIPYHLPTARQTCASFPCDLTDSSTILQLLKPQIDTIYILHGLMSSASEANLDLSLKVNVDSIRNILDTLRSKRAAAKFQEIPPVKVIFASSTAVYGPHVSPDEMITERTAPNPGSSYGAQKHIVETLINDYSRRGLIDGRVVRLPTVDHIKPLKVKFAAKVDLGNRSSRSPHRRGFVFRVRYIPRAIER